MAIAVHKRVPMVSLRLAAALAAVGLFASGVVFAQGANPNDAQIAHIAYTAGQLDIAAAEQAKQKSKNKDVLAFATDMERDHKAVNEKALALVKKLGVTPEDNDTSKALSKQAADKRAELAKLNGKTFDRLTSTMRWPITRRSIPLYKARLFPTPATQNSKTYSRPG
jgi:predicted outer membrane protein